MDLKARVQGILLRPKEEWEKIKEETYPVPQLFSSYVMILAAVPAAAQFIGNWLIGQRIPFYGTYRQGFASGLLDGRTTGAPIALLIRNTGAQSVAQMIWRKESFHIWQGPLPPGLTD